MKEKILNQLKDKLGKTSLSDRTLESKAARLAAKYKTEEEFTSEILEDVVSDLKELDGQLSHDVAEKIKAYKPEKQVETKEDKDKPNPELEALKKKVDTLTEEREKEKRNALTNGLRSEVKSKTNELKVSNSALWNDAVSMVSVKEDTTVDSLLIDVKKVYEEKLKAYVGEGAMPYGGEQRTGMSSVSSKEAEAKREEFKKRQISSGRLPQEETKE